MTFAPGTSRRVGLPRTVRTVVFWTVLLLAFVLWKMANTGDSNRTPEQELNYTEFMQQVDQKNVASAKFYASRATSVIHGTLREPPDRYRVTIANEQVRGATDQLRSEGATIQVVAGTTWIEFLVNIAPFLLIVVFWIYVLKRRHPKPPQPTAPGGIENRPLG